MNEEYQYVNPLSHGSANTLYASSIDSTLRESYYATRASNFTLDSQYNSGPNPPHPMGVSGTPNPRPSSLRPRSVRQTMGIGRPTVIRRTTAMTGGRINTASGEDDGANFPESYHNAVVQVTVGDDQLAYFENTFLPDIGDVLSSWQGFVNRAVHLVRKENGKNMFVILLAFQDLKTFTSWQTSSERAAFVADLKGHGIAGSIVSGGDGSTKTSGPTRIELQSGMTSIPRPVPPPRWKLYLLTFMAIYPSIILVTLNGMISSMVAHGMPLGFAVLMNLSHVVFVIAFAMLPLIQGIPFVEKWLKLPRIPANQMNPIHRTLDQGLQVFAAPKPNPISAEMTGKISKMERYVEALRKANFTLSEKVTVLEKASKAVIPELHSALKKSSASSKSAMKSDQSASDLVNKLADKLRSSKDNQMNQSMESVDVESANDSGKDPLTVSAQFFVKWEYTLAFDRWCDELANLMSTFKGYINLTLITPKLDGEPFHLSYTFDNYENLMEFVSSKQRKERLAEVEYMLEATTEFDVAKERIFRDALTELFVATGGNSAVRPPPLWKIYLLTVFPLFIVNWLLTVSFVPELKNDHVSALGATTVNVFLSSLLNTYVGLPLMLKEFGDWLQVERVFDKNNWFDVGFPRMIQFIIAILYYGLLIIFAAIKLSS